MDAVSGISALLRARYGDAAPAAGPGNAVIEALLAHRSARAFLPRALPTGALEMLVAAAQSASTSSNMQAWSVVAVQDAARKSRLATLAANQEFIREAPLFLAWIADTSRLQRTGEAAGTRLEATDYLESFLVAAVDAALAAQNATVAAESLGLGCVYVGALRNHPLEVAEELRLPSPAVALFGLAVGYPDPARPAEVKPRLPQSVVLHREQYGTEGERAAIAAYDGELNRFSERNAMGATDWSRRMIARLGTVASLRGRDAMREWLKARGFALR
jgi:nitroreductase